MVLMLSEGLGSLADQETAHAVSEAAKLVVVPQPGAVNATGLPLAAKRLAILHAVTCPRMLRAAKSAQTQQEQSRKRCQELVARANARIARSQQLVERSTKLTDRLVRCAD
jgi:hypothetical protein